MLPTVSWGIVTILILIDGFLQLMVLKFIFQINCRHNPYFNRWFSAILHTRSEYMGKIRHNPYFNRWFSAITMKEDKEVKKYDCHNPYFNRWFSAILLDDFMLVGQAVCHNPYFNRWFSAIIKL